MKKLTAALLCGFTCTGVLAARADGETMESLPVINRNICISKIEKPMKAEIQSHYDLHFNGQRTMKQEASRWGIRRWLIVFIKRCLLWQIPST